MYLNPIDEEAFGALQVSGDSEDGFGVFPRFLLDKMRRTGTVWLLVDPAKRVVPQCWDKWLIKVGFRYNNSFPSRHILSQPGSEASYISQRPASRVHFAAQPPGRPRSQSSAGEGVAPASAIQIVDEEDDGVALMSVRPADMARDFVRLYPRGLYVTISPDRGFLTSVVRPYVSD
ncbi:hypothetical protein F5Y12DRAFT_482966 [Xylaria sp. FL1777]|nr:hypothetical protein F5Y12DRAFT_482966 [Xylaria sp. FL1777]